MTPLASNGLGGSQVMLKVFVVTLFSVTLTGGPLGAKIHLNVHDHILIIAYQLVAFSE